MEKSLRMAASAKRRNICVIALLTLLMMAIFSLAAAAKKKPADEQKTTDSQGGQPATQTEQRRDKDDPRARAAYQPNDPKRGRARFGTCDRVSGRSWRCHRRHSVLGSGAGRSMEDDRWRYKLDSAD